MKLRFQFCNYLRNILFNTFEFRDFQPAHLIHVEPTVDFNHDRNHTLINLVIVKGHYRTAIRTVYLNRIAESLSTCVGILLTATSPHRRHCLRYKWSKHGPNLYAEIRFGLINYTRYGIINTLFITNIPNRVCL